MLIASLDPHLHDALLHESVQRVDALHLSAVVPVHGKGTAVLVSSHRLQNGSVLKVRRMCLRSRSSCGHLRVTPALRHDMTGYSGDGFSA